jgi:O-antigen/teichoic acid export membrane protein
MEVPLTTQPASVTGTRGGGAGPVAILTTADQVLSSASNALLVFALAQISPVEQFGIIALLVTIVTVWTGFNRGALGTPLLLTSNLNRREIAIESGYALSWALGSGLLAGLIILAAGAAFGQLWSGLAFAISLPAALAQDVLRFAAIALVRPSIAVAADALWTGWMLLIFAANLFGFGGSAEVTIYLWGLGGVLSALILARWSKVGPRYLRIVDWWRTYYPARLRFGSVYAISNLGMVLVTLVAIASVGSVAAAAVRGGMTLMGPIAMLVSALPMVFVPHARRSGNSLYTQQRLLFKTSVITSVMTLLATACLIALPRSGGSALLGSTWDYAVPLIPYIGIAFAAMCWLISAYSFFQAQGADKMVFWLNIAHIGLQVTMTAAAGLLFGTAYAIGVSLAISSCVMAVVAAAGMLASARRANQGELATSTSVAAASDGVLIQ